MKKYDPLWQNINNLLSFLRGSGVNSVNNVVKIVDDFYAQYNNPAPAQLLQMEIDRLQKRLDEAEKE